MGEQGGYFIWRNQELDASRDAWLALYQALSLEDQHHLMDGRRADTEMSLQVGFCWRAAEDAGIGMDEGEILALLGGESGYRGFHVT